MCELRVVAVITNVFLGDSNKLSSFFLYKVRELNDFKIIFKS